MVQIYQHYVPEFNYWLAFRPKAYREVDTFDRWYHQRSYEAVVRMQARDLRG